MRPSWQSSASEARRSSKCSAAGQSPSPLSRNLAAALRDAITTFGASPQTTFFVGDQKADLQAAYHARCRGILVRTGMGAKTLAEGLPTYLEPVEVAGDLAAAVKTILAQDAVDPSRG